MVVSSIAIKLRNNRPPPVVLLLERPGIVRWDPRRGWYWNPQSTIYSPAIQPFPREKLSHPISSRICIRHLQLSTITPHSLAAMHPLPESACMPALPQRPGHSAQDRPSRISDSVCCIRSLNSVSIPAGLFCTMHEILDTEDPRYPCEGANNRYLRPWTLMRTSKQSICPQDRCVYDAAPLFRAQ